MRNVKISAPRAARKNANSVAPVASVETYGPVAPVAETASVETVAKPVAHIPGFIAKRDATVNIAAYPFQITSNRDAAYLTFYAYAAAANPAGFTLGNLYDIAGVLTDNTAVKRRNPFAGPSIASAPATDAGAAERAIKRGVLHIIGTAETGHNIYALTEAGANDAASAIGAAAYHASQA